MNSRTLTTFAKVIESIGEPGFGRAMDTYVKNIASFDMSCMFLFNAQYAPTLVHDGYSQSLSRKALLAYLKGGYLLDPFYVACVNNHPRGIWRMIDLAPDSFFSSGFMISKDIHPCISTDEYSLVEEIGFIVPLNDQASIVYSLMRTHGNNCFSDHEINDLNIVEPIVFSSISSHYRNSFATINDVYNSKNANIEITFIHAFEERLTPTQREVVKMILRGHSTHSIANHMGISTGTVKIHKSNIYRRLGITTQSELFQKFVGYLTNDIISDAC